MTLEVLPHYFSPTSNKVKFNVTLPTSLNCVILVYLQTSKKTEQGTALIKVREKENVMKYLMRPSRPRPIKTMPVLTEELTQEAVLHFTVAHVPVVSRTSSHRDRETQ